MESRNRNKLVAGGAALLAGTVGLVALNCSLENNPQRDELIQQFVMDGFDASSYTEFVPGHADIAFANLMLEDCKVTAVKVGLEYQDNHIVDAGPYTYTEVRRGTATKMILFASASELRQNPEFADC